jgi:hypothetical protein
VTNYPSIEGVVPRFIFGKHHVVQMKMQQKMAPQSAIEILNAAHAKARELGSPERSYLAVLYTTADVNVTAEALPPGSLLVGPGGLKLLLQPLGLSPVLQDLENMITKKEAKKSSK